ncbi:MAG: family peptidase [Hydrocarboniphaga sp.]|uniref:S8 family peptidase n=1 Tax=Hydrocarboniphaga sp. TaxID=2033016 RepID=UPI002639911B|nr:S8 family peptidase [Hydrocarboniphaga sp.]MDB5972420.1 family peptidase [Hydrocarboniphaga sp.]
MNKKSWLATLAAGVVAAVSMQAHAAALVIPEGNRVIADQYIVVLKPDATSAPVRKLALTLVGNVGGGELLQVYDHALKGFAVRLPEIAAQSLAANRLVERIEQDQMMDLVDTQTGAGYNLDRTDQHPLPLSGTYSYPSNAGSGVNVYVIDTGLRSTHTDFSGRVGNGHNFAPNTNGGLLCSLLGVNCPVPDPNNTSDCNGHGTHVSGTAVGTTYGIAKRSLIHPVRVFSCSGSTATSTIVAGVDWVVANRTLPAVANMSLGGAASTTLDDAVSSLINSGVTVVVAAGNDNADACNSSPARLPAAITVGATTSTDARASYSNYGTCLDLFAPGDQIVSASYQSDTGSATLSGTSMASPLVAGVVARYLTTTPGATPAQVAAAITAAATSSVVTNPGTGSPNRLAYASP